MRRGIAGELFFIGGAVVAVLVSIHFYIPASNFVSGYLIIPRNLSDILVFAAINAGIILVFLYIFNVIKESKKREPTGPATRIGGGLLGLAGGFMLCVIVALALSLVPVDFVGRSVRAGSFAGPKLIKAGISIYGDSAGLLPSVKKADTYYFLNGVAPLEFKGRVFRRRSSELDEILR